MKWRAHSDKQEKAVYSDKKILALLTGIQWGKTQTGAIRMKMKMHAYTDPEDNFIIAAPNYKILQQSTLPAFLKIMDGLGDYNKVEAAFRMHGGGICYMRTATEPDSIVGIRNVRHIWIDEAGKVSLYFWENTVARSAFRDCQIDLTSSPYSFNWVYKEIVRPKLKDVTKLPNIELIQAASWENPYFPPATIDHARETMDARRFGALFGGLWEKQVGLVYDCFDESENTCKPFELPSGTRYVAGIDWGFTHPFAMHIRAITPQNMHFQVGEVHRTGLTVSQIVEICKQKKSIFNIEKFYCDPAQPAHIEELCRYGCPAVPANNEVQLGIDRHYELVKLRQFKIFEGTSPFSLENYDTYHYAEPDSLSPDKDAKDRGPVKQDDDQCFVAGTLIKSNGVDVPIEELEVGDYVDTPVGPQKILLSFVTKDAEVMTVRLSDGNEITCTPHHKFYKPFAGFIPLHDWTPGDIITSCKDLKLSVSTAKIIIFAANIIESLEVSCIAIFMSLLTVQYRRAMRFITSISTALTTKLKTWLRFIGLSIEKSIQTELPMRDVKNCANWPQSIVHLRKRGTRAPRDMRGMFNMEAEFSETDRRKNSPAKTAAKHTAAKTLVGLSFARTAVNLLLDLKAARIILKSRALSVAGLLLKTNIEKQKPVRVSVLTRCKARQNVYNIKVDVIGGYFANGIYVRNCDAARYTTIMTYTGNMKHKIKVPEEREKGIIRPRDTSNNWMKKNRYKDQTENWN